MTRRLPASEYDRLPNDDMKKLAGFVNPGDMQVMVVEDGADIVACWAVLRIVHLEGVWIHPGYRHKPSIARRLLTATLDVARQWSPKWVMTAAAPDDHVTKRLLTKHLRAISVPMEPYVFDLNGVNLCR